MPEVLIKVNSEKFFLTQAYAVMERLGVQRPDEDMEPTSVVKLTGHYWHPTKKRTKVPFTFVGYFNSAEIFEIGDKVLIDGEMPGQVLGFNISPGWVTLAISPDDGGPSLDCRGEGVVRIPPDRMSFAA